MMFVALWTFVEMTTLICGYCCFYGEIVKFHVKEKAKIEVNALHAVNEQLRREAHRVGLYYKKEGGGFYLYHTDEWLLDMQHLRKENKNLRKDNDLYEKQFIAMCKYASRNGYQFEFKDGKCVGMILKKV
jgi:hypothetical protein